MAFCNRLIKDVWAGRDNVFRLRLDLQPPDSASTPFDLSEVTLVELSIDGAILAVEANASNAAINWWDADLGPGEAQFILGDFVQEAAIPPGQYPAELVLYAGPFPDGIVWSSIKNRELLINVIS